MISHQNYSVWCDITSEPHLILVKGLPNPFFLIITSNSIMIYIYIYISLNHRNFVALKEQHDDLYVFWVRPVLLQLGRWCMCWCKAATKHRPTTISSGHSNIVLIDACFFFDPWTIAIKMKKDLVGRSTFLNLVLKYFDKFNTVNELINISY